LDGEVGATDVEATTVDATTVDAAGVMSNKTDGWEVMLLAWDDTSASGWICADASGL